jgi:hypothetical protein
MKMEPLRTYATRFARLCYLRTVCPEDHPVVKTEKHLLDMARSKFQEAMFSRYDEGEVPEIRPVLECAIRRLAKSGLEEQIPDADVRRRVSSSIDEESFDRLFVLMH